MKSILLKAFLIVLASIFALTSSAQIKTKIFPQGVPANKIAIQPDKIPIKIIKAPNELLELQKSIKIPTEYSNRFAIAKSVDLDFLAEAKMVEEKGLATYILTVQAEKALNISIEFKERVFIKMKCYQNTALPIICRSLSGLKAKNETNNRKGI